MQANSTISNQIRYQQARRITLIGACTNILLATIKILFGVIGRSHALVADGIHSFSDLLTDLLVLAAAKFGSQAADADHPYGHQRIETLGTVALSLILILVGAAVIVDAVLHLLTHRGGSTPDFFVLVVAIVSLFINEVLFRYTLRIANQLQSELMRANAWHRRSDAASSLVVLIGVVGAMLGLPSLDAIAASLVGTLIIKMGGELGWKGLRELIDTGLDPATLAAITQTIKSVTGVKNIHELRTRMMAGKILVDVHVLVNSRLSVSEGHYIGEQVHLKLMREHPQITHVTVHVDPENDEVVMPSSHLPPRKQLLQELQQRWHDLPGSDSLAPITLHYLSGKLHIEIGLPLQLLQQYSAEELTSLYQKALPTHLQISSLKLWFG